MEGGWVDAGAEVAAGGVVGVWTPVWSSSTQLRLEAL